LNVGEGLSPSRLAVCLALLVDWQQGGFIESRRLRMVKVKTFATELKIFQTMKELYDLDEQVNQFIKENDINNIVSVSDTCTTDDKGATIGLIRVVAYE
jgi:hypothetical protein